MKKTLLAAVLLMSMHAYAQQDDDHFYDWDTHTSYQKMKYAPNDDVTYRGRISFEEMKNLGEFGWVRDGADNYTPNQKKIAFLRKNLEPYEVVVFMAFWDDKSHEVVPALYKILNEANYWGNYTMYSVNKSVTTNGNEYAQYHIHELPVIILKRDNVEVGRITGTPEYSLEDDLATLVERDLMAHPYKR